MVELNCSYEVDVTTQFKHFLVLRKIPPSDLLIVASTYNQTLDWMKIHASNTLIVFFKFNYLKTISEIPNLDLSSEETNNNPVVSIFVKANTFDLRTSQIELLFHHLLLRVSN